MVLSHPGLRPSVLYCVRVRVRVCEFNWSSLHNLYYSRESSAPSDSPLRNLPKLEESPYVK